MKGYRMNKTTKRLNLRPFQPTDAEDLYEYLSDPEVVKYEPYKPQTKEACIKEAVNRSNSDCFVAVVLREEGKVIGNLYFKQVEPSKVNTYEVGYVFNGSYQGSGYATEGLEALVQDLFQEKKAHRIIAMCNTENIGSWKLLERLGFRREATRVANMYFEWDQYGNPLWFDSYQYALLEPKFEKGPACP